MHVNPHYAPGASPVVGRIWKYRGRANLRKQEKPTPGLTESDGARLAAGHCSRKGAAWFVQEKEGGHGLRPCEDSESSGWGSPRVVVQLQKSVGGGWSQIRSANALQKKRQGRVNGDLGWRDGQRVIPMARAPSERRSRRSDSPVKQTGEDRQTGPEWREIVIHWSHHHASGEAVTGPGL